MGTNNVVVYSNDSEETVTVTGLTSGTTYYVAVYAYSATGFLLQYHFLLPGGSKTTTPKDADSDITRAVGGESATPIEYYTYQAASNLTEGGSASLFTFNINDSATGTDGLRTILTAISFDITNHENLRMLALFDGTTNIAELEVAENIINNTLSFAELSIVATSGMSKAVNVRATFLERVDDGEQIELTISAVSAKASGSTFADGNGGGATTDITTSSDVNAIAVTATALAITAPKVALVSQDFKLTVTAS